MWERFSAIIFIWLGFLSVTDLCKMLFGIYQYKEMCEPVGLSFSLLLLTAKNNLLTQVMKR